MKFLLLSNFERSTNAGFISRAVVRLSLTTMDNWKEKLTAFIFHFLEGTVQSDWFFTRSVFSYLCSRATVTLFEIRRVHPKFRCHFSKTSRFFGWAVFLTKDVGYYLNKITYESSLFSLSNHFG